MKKISVLVLLGLLSASGVSADTLSVKITSLISIDTTGHLAEACGEVTGQSATSPTPVTVISDPKRNPGVYTVFTDPNGVFCTVIATATGQAEATTWLSSPAARAKSDIVTMTSSK